MPKPREGAEARVPLVDENPLDPIVAEVFARFAVEDRSPIALYRALALVPAVLRGYGAMASGVRYETALESDLRELVILRIAQLTGSAYEWAHHRPLAAAVGISEQQLASLTAWEDSEDFDLRQKAALRLADEMHLLEVTDETFESVRGVLGEQRAVELVVISAFYEAVARIIQGLGIAVEDGYSDYLAPYSQ